MSLNELFEYISTQDTDTKRVCGMCGQVKPVQEFYRDGHDSSGNIRYRRDCKECYKKIRFNRKDK